MIQTAALINLEYFGYLKKSWNRSMQQKRNIFISHAKFWEKNWSYSKFRMYDVMREKTIAVW